MGTLRNVALVVLAISLLTFIAFFGRLPAFRNTPIGFLHRLLWIHIPKILHRLDARFTQGRITRRSSQLIHHLFNDRHPVVLIFFLTLLTTSATLFIPCTWPHLSPTHHTLIPTLLAAPYAFTYLTATSRTHHITPHNHSQHLRRYPYDRILYHPRRPCRTCGLAKPARSKHCSVCKICVGRADHHCVWVNCCLGRGNYKWFLALLASTALLLAYGAWLAYVVLAPQVGVHFGAWPEYHTAQRQMSAGSDAPRAVRRVVEALLTAVDALATAMQLGGISVAGVGLLALLTAPLPAGLLAYHGYLIWAGMTTNEASKWSDWRDDMDEGCVFMGAQKWAVREDGDAGAERDEGVDGWGDGDGAANSGMRKGGGCHGDGDGMMGMEGDPDEPPTGWPYRSRQILVRTSDGQPPNRSLPKEIADVVQEGSWRRCWRLAEVENIYDLGFWGNLMEVLRD